MQSGRTRTYSIAAHLVSALTIAAVLSAGAAEVAPPGIHIVSVPPSGPFGPSDPVYHRLSSDGSMAWAKFQNVFWSYGNGHDSIFRPEARPGSVTELSSDFESLLISIGGGRKAIAARDGTIRSTIERQVINESVELIPHIISPNGLFVAATGFPAVPPPLSEMDSGRWDATGRLEVLDRPADFVMTDVVSVTDDGTVYGHGYVNRVSTSILDAKREAGLRWNPDGSVDRLAGTNADGASWRLKWIDYTSPDGTFRLGTGSIDRPVAGGTGVAPMDIFAVFDDTGPILILNEPNGAVPFIDGWGMNADASVVFANKVTFETQPFGFLARPWIWANGQESVPFEVYLRTFGLDPGDWHFESMLDVSDDGRAFLVEGYSGVRPSDGRLSQLIVVIPEPGAVALLGFGLVLLTLARPKSAGGHRRSSPRV